MSSFVTRAFRPRGPGHPWIRTLACGRLNTCMECKRLTSENILEDGVLGQPPGQRQEAAGRPHDRHPWARCTSKV